MDSNDAANNQGCTECVGWHMPCDDCETHAVRDETGEIIGRHDLDDLL